jgi:hypothetical protein
MAGAALAAEIPVPGLVLRVELGKVTKFVARPGRGESFPLPDANDMPPISVSPPPQFGECILSDPSEWTLRDLDAGTWKALGTPPGSKGFTYKGAGTPADPCTSVVIKPKMIKAICRGGTDPDFTIPVAPGVAGAKLMAGGNQYLAVFDTDTFKTDNGVRGLFIARGSAAYLPGPLDPGVFSGGTVPVSPLRFKNEQKAAGAEAKLAAAVAKCYVKGAKNLSSGKFDGVANCLGTGNPAGTGALDVYAATIDGLTLPGCHAYGVPGDGSLIAALVKGFQPGIYCTSPSGAFVDGLGGL